MPNIELQYDQVYNEDIRVANSQGVFEPVPNGDAFSVAVSDGSGTPPAYVSAAVGTNPKTNNPGVVVTPLNSSGPYPNVVVTVSDTTGLTPWVLTFDLMPDATPLQIVGDPNSVDLVSQPAPPA